MGYTLSNIVKEYLIEQGDTDLNKYARFLQIGVAGLREFNLDFSGIPVTIQIPVVNGDVVPLPAGYIQYVKIAVVNSEGNICELGLNSKMTLKRIADNCGNPEISIPINSPYTDPANVPGDAIVEGAEYYSDNYRNGEVMGRFFGIGGGNNGNGYYRVDKENGYIQLAHTNASFIVLECLVDISLTNGDFEVHPYLVESVKAWMFWKSIQRNPRYGLGEKQIAKQDYIQAKRAALSRYNAATLQEWLSAFRSGNYASVKW